MWTDIWADTLTPHGRQRIKEVHAVVCGDSRQRLFITGENQPLMLASVSNEFFFCSHYSTKTSKYSTARRWNAHNSFEELQSIIYIHIYEINELATSSTLDRNVHIYL